MSVTIHIAPQFEKLRPLIEAIATNGVPAQAHEIYRARNRVYTLDADDTVLNIKSFKVPSFPNGYIYTTIRQSKARRSFANAERLLEMGIGTAPPVAYIEKKRHGRLRESYYISIQMDVDGDMREWLDNPRAQAALPALAAEIARLHHLGIRHKDLSPGNIMFRADATAPHGYRFYLIDLNRMRFGVHSHALHMRNFESIYLESAEQTGHLAELYAPHVGMDPQQARNEAIEAHRRFVRRKLRLKKMKNLFRK